MNERIKELAEQATTIEHGVDNGFDRVTFDKAKFAELLLLDVMETQCLSEWERQNLCEAYGLEYKPVMMKHPSFGDLYSLYEWNEAAYAGYFNSDDGSGYWATKTHYAYVSCWDQMPDWATHVLWFNK